MVKSAKMELTGPRDHNSELELTPEVRAALAQKAQAALDERSDLHVRDTGYIFNNEPALGLSAVDAVTHDDDDNLLMVIKDGALWLPGGMKEDGETDEQAVIRELAEETGHQFSKGNDSITSVPEAGDRRVAAGDVRIYNLAFDTPLRDARGRLTGKFDLQTHADLVNGQAFVTDTAAVGVKTKENLIALLNAKKIQPGDDADGCEVLKISDLKARYLDGDIKFDHHYALVQKMFPDKLPALTIEMKAQAKEARDAKAFIRFCKRMINESQIHEKVGGTYVYTIPDGANFKIDTLMANGQIEKTNSPKAGEYLMIDASVSKEDRDAIWKQVNQSIGQDNPKIIQAVGAYFAGESAKESRVLTKNNLYLPKPGTMAFLLKVHRQWTIPARHGLFSRVAPGGSYKCTAEGLAKLADFVRDFDAKKISYADVLSNETFNARGISIEPHTQQYVRFAYKEASPTGIWAAAKNMLRRSCVVTEAIEKAKVAQRSAQQQITKPSGLDM